MTTYIYPYKKGSASAKALANALGVKRIKLTNSRFKPKGKTVINWGSSSVPYDCNVINPPSAISEVSNKLAFFQSQTDIGNKDCIVPWTVSKYQAEVWLLEGQTVVARTKLTGHSGEGIVLLEGGAEIIEAPLYTLYTPKKHEFRVHCFRKQVENADVIQVFDVQRKARKTDVPNDDVNWKVRNLKGGFIYAREGFEIPEVVEDIAMQVFEATALDFGAIDIIYNEQKNKAWALEVNTAPGLTGTTLTKYVEMFKEMLGE